MEQVWQFWVTGTLRSGLIGRVYRTITSPKVFRHKYTRIILPAPYVLAGIGAGVGAQVHDGGMVDSPVKDEG